MKLNREWLNSNETRNYPIKEGLDRAASSGFVLPNSYIADFRLSGTRERIEVSPTVFENVDYFIHEIERGTSINVSGDTVDQIHIRIREINRASYNPGDSATFRDVGEFIIPFGSSQDQAFPFIPSISSSISGKLVVRKHLDGLLSPGLHSFTPDNTTLEARTLIPASGTPKVTALVKDGDAFRAEGDVVIGEGTGLEVTPVVSANGLRLDFNAVRECETLSEEGGCLDDVDRTCAQPAIMNLNKATSDRNFNFKIGGGNGINVSTLPVLVPGGNPFNPNDYTVNSIVVTYQGPITAQFLGGDPTDANNYVYGLDCKQTPLGQALPSVLAQSQSLIDELYSRRSMLSLI
jgi:hypothetical protein